MRNEGEIVDDRTMILWALINLAMPTSEQILLLLIKVEVRRGFLQIPKTTISSIPWLVVPRLFYAVNAIIRNFKNMIVLLIDK